MTEVLTVDPVVTASASDVKENIASRRTIVYKTFMDPAVARVEGEKNKQKLFKKFLLNVNRPEDIEFVSTEKYYEPIVTVSGKYMIDYYRKCSYTIDVGKEVNEVILHNNTFVPNGNPDSYLNKRTFKVEGEERILRNQNAFLFMNKDGQEAKIKDFPTAPSEENPEELIQTLRMPEIAPTMDVYFIRQKIAQRPAEASRVVSEQFDIDQRSVIYRPIFRITFKCPKINKQAYVEFDGVTSKKIQQGKNGFFWPLSALWSKLK